MTNERLQELLADHQFYHSDLQIDHLILARSGAGTLGGLYKQALRELFKRYRILRGLYATRARTRIELDKVPWWKYVVRFVAGAAYRQCERIRQAERELSFDDLERNIADTEREFNRFLAHADALKRKVGPLTPERRTELDREYWCHTLRNSILQSALSGQRPDGNTVEFLAALPSTIRKTIFDDIGRVLPGEQLPSGEVAILFSFLDAMQADMETLSELPPSENNGKGLRLLLEHE